MIAGSELISACSHQGFATFLHPLIQETVSFQMPAYRPHGMATFQTPPTLTYGMAYSQTPSILILAPAIVFALLDEERALHPTEFLALVQK
jgi:hypothetical protein